MAYFFIYVLLIFYYTWDIVKQQTCSLSTQYAHVGVATPYEFFFVLPGIATPIFNIPPYVWAHTYLSFWVYLNTDLRLCKS